MAVATLDKKTANKGNKPEPKKPAATGAPSDNGTESNESKDAKFKRLATKRSKVILKAISGFGNLGNKNAYTYTDAQIEKIFGAFEGAVRDAKAKFSKAAEKKDFHIEL